MDRLTDRLLGLAAAGIELHANVNRGLPTRDPAALAQAVRPVQFPASFIACKVLAWRSPMLSA